MKVTAEIRNECASQWTPDAALCTTWIESALRSVGHSRDCDISISFVDAAAIAVLNARYRDKPQPTNVLSFPGDFPEQLVHTLAYQPLGDIVICPSVMAAEAQQQSKELQSHWAHIMIHGVLHLLGYDHIKPAAARRMEQIEIEALATLGIPDPYLIG
jgi:probable rRNA maturation factor